MPPGTEEPTGEEATGEETSGEETTGDETAVTTEDKEEEKGEGEGGKEGGREGERGGEGGKREKKVLREKGGREGRGSVLLVIRGVRLEGEARMGKGKRLI